MNPELAKPSKLPPTAILLAEPTLRKRVAPWLGIGLPAAIILLAILAPPWSILEKAHLIGYGVCHQLPERSFQPGGIPLPLCARCSGTFLGALFGFASLWAIGKGRAAGLPPLRILAVLAGFIVLMGVDGLNSYLTFFPGLPYLYQPSNTMRLITGLLSGLALSTVLLPILNLTLWQHPEIRPVIKDLRTVGGLVVAMVPLMLLVNAEWGITLYPLAILDVLGVVVMLAAINAIIVAIVLRRENTARGWRDALPFFLWGGVLTLLEIGAIDLFRSWLERMLPTPL